MGTDAAPSPLALVLDRAYTGEGAFERVERLLVGLTPEQAVTRLPGMANSIAWHVAHMSYWLRLYLEFIAAAEAWEGPPPPPEPTADDWQAVTKELQGLLAEAAGLAADPALTERTVAFPTGSAPAATLLGDCAAHNAYHWGQVVLTRRLLGAWPPAG